MRPQSAAAPQPSQPSARRVGSGLDTSRYGPYAAFLRDALQPAAEELPFAEAATGYALFRPRLEHSAPRQGPSPGVVRRDAAGPYADNVLPFLPRRGTPTADTPAPVPLTVSCGDRQRNQNYQAALFGPQQADPVEARAAARFALTQRPPPSPALSLEQRTLRQVAGRLQAVVRQRTRLIKQFHHLLALTFPERALRTTDHAAGWVRELVYRVRARGRQAADAQGRGGRPRPAQTAATRLGRVDDRPAVRSRALSRGHAGARGRA